MKKEEIFTLESNRTSIMSFVKELYNNFTSLSNDIRNDHRERTGIKILIREIGTSNIILESLGKPREAAQFYAIEKAVRSEILGHAASQNSANSEKKRFAGSVTIYNYQVSVSGLKADEDVFISIAVMAKILGESIEFVISEIAGNGGLLPEWCSNRKLYHWSVL